MKNLSKIGLFVLILSCIALISSSNVFASSYTSYLDIREGNDLNGTTRNFTAGNYGISIYPQSFKWYGSCTLTTDLYRKDLIGKTFLSGQTNTMNSTGVTYTFYMGNFSQCNAYYYFLSRSGGIYANPVTMFS